MTVALVAAVYAEAVSALELIELASDYGFVFLFAMYDLCFQNMIKKEMIQLVLRRDFGKLPNKSIGMVVVSGLDFEDVQKF